MISFFSQLINLHNGEQDKQKTIDTVLSNISFRGANLWILACAIIIASVGLNVNSTAVIIGAMLISPLMGPIVGAGFALGIYHFDLLKRSLKNLFIATFAGLIVSTTYFYLSPFKDVQSELLARTSPNIYDVLIAFFGGLVGVISITRVEKGNPIPGVAIATALMPPLCTAGFGIATGNFMFSFGALYLYAINCVFICISTYIVVKYLKFPPQKNLDDVHQKRIKYGITILTTLMLVPSAYFAFLLYKKQEFSHNVEYFIEKEFVEKGNTIVFKKTKYSPRLSSIELAFLSKHINQNELNILNEKLKLYGLSKTKLVIKPNSSIDINALKNDILNEISRNDIKYSENNEFQTLQNRIEKDSIEINQVFEEVKALFPNIKGISLANHNFITSDTTFKKSIFLYEVNPKLSKIEKTKLQSWLQKRLSVKELQLFEE